jgi:hypothetical protein
VLNAADYVVTMGRSTPRRIAVPRCVPHRRRIGDPGGTPDGRGAPSDEIKARVERWSN